MKPESNVHFKNLKKVYSHDLDKARTPEETVEWISNRFRVYGKDILLDIKRIDTGRLGIPVFISLCGKEATNIIGKKKQMGKGATELQARASALMELAERYSFFHFVKKVRKPFFKLSDIKDTAVGVDEFLKAIHDVESDVEKVEKFLLNVPLRWVAARNVTKNEDRWIPFDWFYIINEYNGPASGNELEEAVLQGLCEVVERHVGTLISYNRIMVPDIDPESLTLDVAGELLSKFRSCGIRLHLKDFSMDTGVPSVGALAYDPATFPERSEIVFTVGTTPDPEKSLCRALTEIAQLAGDFESSTSYKPTYPKYSSLDEADYLTTSSKKVAVSSLPNLSSDDILEELLKMVEVLYRNKEWNVFVVNITHDVLKVPAAYVIVPGAHFLDRASGTDFPQHMARVLIGSLTPREASVHIRSLIETFGDRYDLRFFLGHVLEESGDIEEAERLYSRSLYEAEDSNEKASIMIHLASCCMKKERYSEALKLLEKAEDFNPYLKELHHLRGVCLFRMKKHKESIEAFERAIELDPSSAIDYANIASNLRDMGHKEEAIVLYEMALDLDPSLDFARDNLLKLKAS